MLGRCWACLGEGFDEGGGEGGCRCLCDEGTRLRWKAAWLQGEVLRQKSIESRWCC